MASMEIVTVVKRLLFVAAVFNGGWRLHDLTAAIIAIFADVVTTVGCTGGGVRGQGGSG
jgi:hypothetical protein